MEAGLVKQNFTILCVDDEQIPLALRKLVLEKAGFQVVTAGSAAEALEALRTRTFDLVLSDLLMPVMNGAELTRIIKEQNPGLPVVIVSGVNEIPPEAEIADLFISKLSGPENLQAQVANVLAARAAAVADGCPQPCDE